MPRRRYDDDEEGFPDIRQKPGTPSDSFGGAYGPPDSDSESGYSRPGTAGSGESGSASLTFEDWQKKAGLGSVGGEDEFSKTDGSARDARRALRARQQLAVVAGWSRVNAAAGFDSIVSGRCKM